MRIVKKRAFTGFGVVLLFVLVFAIFGKVNFQTVVVRGPSMQPTFHTGQRVLVSKAYWLIGPIKDKDVVVIHDDSPDNPDGYIIKRVFKMGGETVDYYNAGKNAVAPNTDFLVPSGTVYVLGDNRPKSEDSRFFGPVPIEKVLGKVVVRP